MEVLQAKNLKKIYGSGNNAVHALDGVDLSVKKGEFVAIVGTSGSGKSTLLHMLGGLDRPTSGTVMVDGQDIFSLKEEALTIFRRRKIGFVFQAYNLVPVLNVYENIVLPIELDGGKVNKDFVQQIVQTLGLDDRLDALPNQLSGGQQQRVAIARALAAAPAIILADEPTGNLDSKTSQDVLSLLKVTSQILCAIIGLVGLLNFFNAMMTSILSRRREFAVLQAVGMTNRQLKTMLIYEGLFYAMSSVSAAFILSLAVGPLAGKMLGSMFWFFEYRFTILPVLLTIPVFLLLGWLIPCMMYDNAAKCSVVEQLRDAQ